MRIEVGVPAAGFCSCHMYVGMHGIAREMRQRKQVSPPAALRVVVASTWACMGRGCRATEPLCCVASCACVWLQIRALPPNHPFGTVGKHAPPARRTGPVTELREALLQSQGPAGHAARRGTAPPLRLLPPRPRRTNSPAMLHSGSNRRLCKLKIISGPFNSGCSVRGGHSYISSWQSCRDPS